MSSQIILTAEELSVIVKVWSSTKKKKIIQALMEHRRKKGSKNPMYYNEIFDVVGGSKSTVADALEELESDGILKSELRIQDTGAAVNPLRAVRTFEIGEEYAKLFERLKGVL